MRNCRICITALHCRFIEVQILNSTETHCLPRITFSFNPHGSSWTVNHKQLPLQAAYATMFNGSQGLTLHHAIVDLHCDPFAHGQLYTVLSRVRSCDDIRILFPPTNEDYCALTLLFKVSHSLSQHTSEGGRFISYYI